MEFFFFWGNLLFTTGLWTQKPWEMKGLSCKKMGYNCYDPSKNEGKPWVPRQRAIFFSVSPRKQDVLPGDSKWPFHPLVGGHLPIENGHLTIPKRSHRSARLWYFHIAKIESSQWILDTSSKSSLGRHPDPHALRQKRRVWDWGLEEIKRFAGDRRLTIDVRII